MHQQCVQNPSSTLDFAVIVCCFSGFLADLFQIRLHMVCQISLDKGMVFAENPRIVKLSFCLVKGYGLLHF